MWLIERHDAPCATTREPEPESEAARRRRVLRTPLSDFRPLSTNQRVCDFAGKAMSNGSALYFAWFIIAAIVLVFFCTTAQPHDIYGNWAGVFVNEQTGDRWVGTPGSCCHEQDCYPTDAKRIGGNWWARRKDGKFVLIPKEKWNDSTDVPGDRGGPGDGRTHLCTSGESIFCFEPGSGT